MIVTTCQILDLCFLNAPIVSSPLIHRVRAVDLALGTLQEVRRTRDGLEVDIQKQIEHSKRSNAVFNDG